jgi:hypothetical protein
MFGKNIPVVEITDIDLAKDDLEIKKVKKLTDIRLDFTYSMWAKAL